MPSFKVNVKWGREVYKDIECNTDDEPMVFKAQLFALTGVQPMRQKVMLRGTTLKDDGWGKLPIKDAITFLLMGSKEEDLPKEPATKPVFVEDMGTGELNAALNMPAGLKNLGNTCYMNATVQCLRTVPELRQALVQQIEGGGEFDGNQSSQTLAHGIKTCFDRLESIGTGKNLPMLLMDDGTLAPVHLLRLLHQALPHFAQKNDHGQFTQQDANECWTEFMRTLQNNLKPLPGPDGTPSPRKSFVDQYFGVTMESEMKCLETEDEEPKKSTEEFLQLSCFISPEVKYLQSGLLERMSETLKKRSPTLERDAEYKRTLKVIRLPAYLTVQFVRFYYKEKEAVNAKILKDVKFPMSLDVFELCSPELQKKLMPARSLFKEKDDRDLERAAVKIKKVDDDAGSEKKLKALPVSFPDDPGSSNSGYYELQGVLTHQGRSSSSGHYVGWIKLKGTDPKKPATWFKMDDDRVTPVEEEEILKLSGGGDWHCAYVLLYGPRVLEVEEGGPEDLKVRAQQKQSSDVEMK